MEGERDVISCGEIRKGEGEGAMENGLGIEKNKDTFGKEMSGGKV